MAKHNQNTPTAAQGFAADAKAPVVGETPAPAANEDSNESDGFDALDEVTCDAGPDPIGVLGVYLSDAKPVETTKGKRIILEFTLEEAQFEGVEPSQIWLDPKNRDDIARARSISTAIGDGWEQSLGRPRGGWGSLRNKRGRAVFSVWEKDSGEVEFQISKFPPMFSDTTDGHGYRDAFVKSCVDAGMGEPKIEVISKGKHAGKFAVRGGVFGGCGILPLAE